MNTKTSTKELIGYIVMFILALVYLFITNKKAFKKNQPVFD